MSWLDLMQIACVSNQSYTRGRISFHQECNYDGLLYTRFLLLANLISYIHVPLSGILSWGGNSCHHRVVGPHLGTGK